MIRLSSLLGLAAALTLSACTDPRGSKPDANQGLSTSSSPTNSGITGNGAPGYNQGTPN